MKPFIGLLALVLAGCHNNSATTGAKAPVTQNGVQTTHPQSGLLSHFSSKVVDTLWIYSTPNGKGVLEGKALDSVAATKFPPAIVEKHIANAPGIFAVYRFPLGPAISGLLARTPDWFVANSMKLFYYNQQQDSITSFVELAQRWGDAGDFHRKDAWVFRAADSSLQALVWFYQEHDNSVENPADKTKTIRQSYTLLNLSGPKADTVSKDSATLARQFSYLTHNLAKKPYGAATGY